MGFLLSFCQSFNFYTCVYGLMLFKYSIMFAGYVFTFYKASSLSLFDLVLNSGLFYANALLGKDRIMGCFGACLFAVLFKWCKQALLASSPTDRIDKLLNNRKHEYHRFA